MKTKRGRVGVGDGKSEVTETITLHWLGSSGAWNLCFFDFWHWILLQLYMTHHVQILWNMAQSSLGKGALPTLSQQQRQYNYNLPGVSVSALPAADIPCKIVSTRKVPNRRTLYTNPIRTKCRPISSAFPNILLQFHLMLNSAVMLTTTSPVTMSQKDSQ